jgi:hypothetical protein
MVCKLVAMKAVVLTISNGAFCGRNAERQSCPVATGGYRRTIKDGGEGIGDDEVLTLLSDWTATDEWYARWKLSTKKFASVVSRAKKSPTKTYMSCSQDKQRRKEHTFGQ